MVTFDRAFRQFERRGLDFDLLGRLSKGALLNRSSFVPFFLECRQPEPDSGRIPSRRPAKSIIGDPIAVVGRNRMSLALIGMLVFGAVFASIVAAGIRLWLFIGARRTRGDA